MLINFITLICFIKNLNMSLLNDYLSLRLYYDYLINIMSKIRNVLLVNFSFMLFILKILL